MSNFTDTVELRSKANKALERAREIHSLAAAENRALTADEQKNYSDAMGESLRLSDQATREDELLNNETRMSQSQGTVAGQQDTDDDPQGRETRESQQDDLETRMLRQFIMHGEAGLDAEMRALQVDSDTAGGYIVPGERFVNQLIKGVDDMVYMRQMATVQTVTNAQDLGVPSLDADPSDPDWTTEVASVPRDSAMTFGKRRLHPHPLTKEILTSAKLLRASPLGAENIVRERLTYKFGIAQENNFLNGSGALQPLGVFTASPLGISTSRDVATGNTTTAMTFDGLIEAKFSLKGQYWRDASWMFHRLGVKQIASLKDDNGQYLWRQSVRVGEPDRILDLPVRMSEYVPSTFTAGLYVGIVGSFRHYWIVDALSLSIQRLNELYAKTQEIGFIGILESDGMPVLEEAFARVTLAAS